MLAPILCGLLLVLGGMVLGALLYHNYMTAVSVQNRVSAIVLELENLVKNESNILDSNKTAQKLLDFTKTVLPRLKGMV